MTLSLASVANRDTAMKPEPEPFLASELEAQTYRGGDISTVEIAACQASRGLRPHDARVEVEPCSG
jgi:hypothetical protein